ncbi:MAG: hypothetical protein H0X62_10675 [Bacteroidetes bacterium]|nr:hypothetical protein [Bacteroidota bacterium]
MENIGISNHKELVLHILQQKAEKFSHEVELRNAFKVFLHNIDPVTIIKGSIKELAEDKEVQFDIAKVGLNMSTTFIIDQVLGKNRSIKGFIGSVLAEKLSTSLINYNFPTIFSGIAKLISKSPEQEINASEEKDL